MGWGAGRATTHLLYFKQRFITCSNVVITNAAIYEGTSHCVFSLLSPESICNLTFLLFEALGCVTLLVSGVVRKVRGFLKSVSVFNSGLGCDVFSCVDQETGLLPTWVKVSGLQRASLKLLFFTSTHILKCWTVEYYTFCVPKKCKFYVLSIAC